MRTITTAHFGSKRYCFYSCRAYGQKWYEILEMWQFYNNFILAHCDNFHLQLFYLCISWIALSLLTPSLSCNIRSWGFHLRNYSNATGTSKQIMVFMMPAIWRIKSSEWICPTVNKSNRALSEILPLRSFYSVTIFFVSCSSSQLLLFWVWEGEAGCFLSNNLLCLVSFFFVYIFLPITLCIFFSEKKNMNNVNIITQVRISTRDHLFKGLSNISISQTRK